jgi:hypothetical protein
MEGAGRSQSQVLDWFTPRRFATIRDSLPPVVKLSRFNDVTSDSNFKELRFGSDEFGSDAPLGALGQLKCPHTSNQRTRSSHHPARNQAISKQIRRAPLPP